MKILSITLEGYRGFRLRQINKFTYTPTVKTQVILGTNGSGKSSLLKELSPLPAISHDFTKHGAKIIEIEHHGQHYKLSSLFTEHGNRYLFELNGENINPGETISVYRDLCKTHFNYTEDTHKLLTGKMKLSRMSVSERRAWFTKISNLDYGYAIAYYNKLKEKVRDTQGALKSNQSRLVQETDKLLSEKEEQETRSRIVFYRDTLDMLLKHRHLRLPDATRQSYFQSLKDTEEKLTSTIEQLESHLYRYKTLKVRNVTELEKLLIQYEVNIRTLTNEIVKHNESILKKQQTLQQLSLNQYGSIGEVDEKMMQVGKEIQIKKGSVTLPITYDNGTEAYQSYQACRGVLEEILDTVRDIPVEDRTLNYQALCTNKMILKQHIDNDLTLEKNLFNKKTEYEHYKAKDAINCPNCNHQWHLHYDEIAYRNTLRQYEAILNQRIAQEKQYEHLTLKEKHYTMYMRAYENYSKLCIRFNSLSPLWEYIHDNHFFPVETDKLSSLLNTIQTDLYTYVEIDRLSKDLLELSKIHKSMEEAKEVDKSKLEVEIQEETKLVESLQLRYQNEIKQHMGIEEHIALIKSVQSYKENILSYKKTRDESILALVMDDCTMTLDDIIHNTKLTLSTLERSISQIDIQKALVKSLQETITTQTKELNIGKLALKALSPTEGLIAKGMTGFINHFLLEVNDFINRIWLYPLEIQPIKIDEGSLDLDYRFPVSVNNDSRLTPDISNCSAGMQEIIDLAFVALSMKYLGLSQYPIFLDEFAITLDNAHRESAYKAVSYIVNNSNYSQVYLVSHYQDTYVDLSEAQICVLCDNNLMLPKSLSYNTHVSIS